MYNLNSIANINKVGLTLRGSAASIPAKYNGLVGWYDFKDPTVVKLNGSTIERVIDKSQRKHDLVQSTAANQPAYNKISNLLNGHSCASFDGVNDFLDAPLLPYGNAKFDFDGTDAQTVFVVFKPDIATASSFPFIMGRRSGSNVLNRTFGIELRDAVPGNGFRCYTRGDYGTVTNAATSPYDGNVHLGFFDYDGSTPRLGMDGRINAVNNVDLAAQTSDKLVIGNSGTAGNWYRGLIGEIIIYDTVLSTEDRQEMETYFSWRWAGAQ